MAIYIAFRRNYSPVVMIDNDLYARVLGFYRTPIRAYLEILDPDNQPVMVPLQEETHIATANAGLIYYAAIISDCEVTLVSVSRVNSAKTDDLSICTDDLKAHITKLTSDYFRLEVVDLSSVGKAKAPVNFDSMGKPYQCVSLDRLH